MTNIKKKKYRIAREIFIILITSNYFYKPFCLK